MRCRRAEVVMRSSSNWKCNSASFTDPSSSATGGESNVESTRTPLPPRLSPGSVVLDGTDLTGPLANVPEDQRQKCAHDDTIHKVPPEKDGPLSRIV